MRIRRAIALFVQSHFTTRQRSEKTKVAYTTDLEQFENHLGRNLDLRSITPEHLEDWALTLRGSYAPASIRRKFSTLRIFFHHWVRRQALVTSPMWQLNLDFGKQKPLTRALSPAEMRSLLRQAYSDSANGKGHSDGASRAKLLALRNLALLELMFATGIRVGEAATLKVEDFSVSERSLRITGKTGVDRLAFLPDEQSAQALLRYLQRRERIATPHRALFLNAASSPLSTQGIANALCDLAQRAGLKRHVTPHMIRHTSATLLLRNGADLRVVQEFLGHASITSTQRYTHVAKAHLLATVRRRHPVGSLRPKRT